MPDFKLTRRQIRAGVYQGSLAATGRTKRKPALEMRLLGVLLGSVTLTPDSKLNRCWDVRVNIPANILADGVQTFVISDKKTGETLDSFAIITGEVLQDDLRAEIALLQSELDMLKKAFRAHCRETRA
jgi:hypothetical protein